MSRNQLTNLIPPIARLAFKIKQAWIKAWVLWKGHNLYKGLRLMLKSKLEIIYGAFNDKYIEYESKGDKNASTILYLQTISG